MVIGNSDLVRRARLIIPQFVVQASCNHANRPETRMNMNTSSAYGIRTRVPALRGLCPRPLDERAIAKEGRDTNSPAGLRNGNLGGKQSGALASMPFGYSPERVD